MFADIVMNIYSLPKLSLSHLHLGRQNHHIFLLRPHLSYISLTNVVNRLLVIHNPNVTEYIRTGY